jgi:hypothetical protein
MRWTNLKNVLRRKHAEVHIYQSRFTNLLHPGAAVLRARRAVDLDDLLETLADTDEEAQACGDRGIARQVFEEQGWLERLMDFEWEGLNGFTAGLELLSLAHLDDTVASLGHSEDVEGDSDVQASQDYICWLTEEDPYIIVAALAPSAHRALVEFFFSDLLRHNGGPYGIELFGSLPTMMVNLRPDLLSRDAVKQSFLDWLRNWSVRYPGFDMWVRDPSWSPGGAPLTEADLNSFLERYFAESYTEGRASGGKPHG